jgi:hypothetical protein
MECSKMSAMPRAAAFVLSATSDRARGRDVTLGWGN